MKIQKGYSEVFNENMVLRVVNDEFEDFQRFIFFNIVIHQGIIYIIAIMNIF